MTIERWVNEWDLADDSAGNDKPAQRYVLYEELQQKPRLVCKPDAAVLLGFAGYLKVNYVERDRNSDAAERYVASKVKGYSELLRQFVRVKAQFPETNQSSFNVLLIAPHVARRDALRKALVGKPGSELWLVAVTSEVNQESLFFEPVWWPVNKVGAGGQEEIAVPRPLVRRKSQTVPPGLPPGLPGAFPEGSGNREAHQVT